MVSGVLQQSGLTLVVDTKREIVVDNIEKLETIAPKVEGRIILQ